MLLSLFFPLYFVQVDALVQLVKHFGWTWVGVIAGDDAYGQNGANIFVNEVCHTPSEEQITYFFLFASFFKNT